MLTFGDNILTTLRATSTIFVILGCGVLMVKTKKLDRATVSGLSKLVSSLFLPLALFVRLGKNLSFQLFATIWVLPLAGVSLVLVNFLVAYLLSKLANPPSYFKRWFLLLVGVPNNLALPLVFLTSLCEQLTFENSGIIAPLDLGSNETQYLNTLECRHTSELFLFMQIVLITFLFWLCSYELVAAHSVRSYKALHNRASSSDSSNPVGISPFPTEGEGPRGDVQMVEFNSSVDSVVESAQRAAAEHEDPGGLMQRFVGFLYLLLRPTNFAQIVAITIALIPPLQRFVFDEKSPLSPFTDAFSIFSVALVPSLNLVVSGSLGLHVINEGLRVPPDFPKRTVWFMVFGRMVILPAVSFFILYCIGDLIYPNDKLIILIALLITCTPSSNGCIVLAQMAEDNKTAEVLAFVVLCQYAIGLVTMSIYMFIAFQVFVKL